MKKKTVFTIIFVLIVALAIGAGLYYLKKTEPEPKKFSYDLKDEVFFENAQQIKGKLYKSDIEDVFYTLSPTKYYLVKNGKATPIKATGTFKTSVSDTAFTFSFTIPYITVKGERFGVAQCNSANPDSIYNYAFAVLKKMPKGLGSDYENLLLIDTHDNGKSATERTYSEAFALTKNAKSASQLLDTRNRTVESSGKLRTDWFVYTLDSVKHGLYFSGRDYSQNSQRPNYDLYKFASGADKVLAKNVGGTWLGFSDGGIYYLKLGNASFSSVCLKNGKHKKAANISAEISETKIKEGYAFSDMKLINLFDGVITPLNFKKVYDFSADGSALLIVGKEENRESEKFKVQKTMYLTQGDSGAFYANNIMSENTSCELAGGAIITEKEGKTHIISLELI